MIMALSKELDISISALCRILKLPHSSFYYKAKGFQLNEDLVNKTEEIFTENEGSYGTRRIKVKLQEKGYRVSRRKLARIMAFNGLVSCYTKPSFRPSQTESVHTECPNIVNREFDNRAEREVMVSDTTYLRINGKWHYLCIMLDLCGRFLDGYAVRASKGAKLTEEALLSIKCDLREIEIFHSDKGSEFLNKLIEKVLLAFDIKQSTSRKGNAYDNAVAEAMFKTIKTEFVRNRNFESLEQFNREFAKWVHWYNNVRIHSSLGYLTPAEFRAKKRGEMYEKCS